MFSTFAQMLANDERIQFTITKQGESITVLIQPVFKGAANTDTSETVQELRAALAMPLYIVASPAALDAGFPNSLTQYTQTRERLHDSLSDALTRVKENSKSAVSKAEQAEPKTKTKTGGQVTVEPLDNTDHSSQSETPTITSKSLF